MSKHLIQAAVLLGLLTGLAACAGDRAAEQARIDAKDNQDCVDMGFKPNTEPYGNCRLKLRQIRAQSDADAQNNSGVHFGFGLGVSKGF
ncbi:MAG: hypothetical protein ACOH12_07770 [Parvibaculaceae bacterium]